MPTTELCNHPTGRECDHHRVTRASAWRNHLFSGGDFLRPVGVLGEGQAGSILCNGPVCLVAAGEDCISIQEGTFTWSQESAPCLHRYRWWPWEQPSLRCWRGGGGRESESSHRWTGNRVSEPCPSGRRRPPGPQAGHADVDGGLAKRSPRVR